MIGKQAKYFIYFLILVTLVVIFNRYQQYVYNKNFILDVNTVCDPTIEQCFISDCTPGTDSCDITPYKKVEILDLYAPKCLEEHSCSIFTCEEKKGDCSITYCSAENTVDGEKCLEKTKI